MVGYGSNLTMDGQVECDASIMNGLDSSFGSVAAVSGMFYLHGSSLFSITNVQCIKVSRTPFESLPSC